MCNCVAVTVAHGCWLSCADAFHSATSLEKISVNELLLSDLIGKDAFKETSCDERNNDCFEQIA